MHHIVRQFPSRLGLLLLTRHSNHASKRHYQLLRLIQTHHALKYYQPAHQARAVSASAVKNYDEPTIYALSTAPGRAAIAIIRISGVACLDIYRSLCPHRELPKPRRAAVRSLYRSSRSEAQNILDSAALVLYFPAPKTVTGEDVLELHVHGGPAIVKAVLSAIGSCNATTYPVRYAEPGEFTRRAFLNDRLNLPQIEALGDTLSAVTEEQRRVSVQGTTSGLAKRYDSWRQLLMYARGELEALIDFSEDQHFDESPAQLAASVAIQVQSLERRISYHHSNSVRGELLRNGISISLIGAPNAGKSSLLNLIVGRNAAIVSKEAGTTRDIVEVGIDLGGFFCRFCDTAGLRHSAKNDAVQSSANVIGDVEQEGIRRAKERALHSDVVLIVLSIRPSIDGQGSELHLEQEVIDTAKQLIESGKTLLVVINKMDLYQQLSTTNHISKAVQSILPDVDAAHVFAISCLEAENGFNADSVADPGGLQALMTGLSDTFKKITAPLHPGTDFGDMDHFSDPSQWQEALGASQRQGMLLEECAAHLNSFLKQVNSTRDPTMTEPISSGAFGKDSPNQDFDIVMAAESLRAAAECLGKITGRGGASDVEEVLGVVFEKFCVGK